MNLPKSAMSAKTGKRVPFRYHGRIRLMWSSHSPNILSPSARDRARWISFLLRFRNSEQHYQHFLIFLIMALKIRLQRHGASHRPFYRMVVTEALARRDGRFVEVLGTYEPQAKRAEDELSLKLDRVDYWKSVGAKPTDTAASLIRKARREAPAEASAEA